jgi:predicted phosphoadenosine phosphosulfate sulfurtransferase
MAIKIYQKKNVREAAEDRMRWLFQEFENVYLSFSGGKDSTVILNLALQISEELNRLPLKVMFLDQEGEWQATRDYVREVMDDARVEPYWLQCPVKLFNATSHTEQWLNCWEPGDEWMREKEPDSIHENVFGTDRFGEMFPAFLKHYHPDESAIYISGIRTEESPARSMGLTTFATYKHVTYGKQYDKSVGHYNFHPIYDWSYRDVWKAIHDGGWAYNKVYDWMYQHGASAAGMRVSNLHHETALKSLELVQEVEPETWNKMSTRLSGINTHKHVKAISHIVPKDFPPMFQGWEDYRNYLLENLIQRDDQRETIRKEFDRLDEKYKDLNNKTPLYKACVSVLIVNDFEFTKINNFETSPDLAEWRYWRRTGKRRSSGRNQYINS